MFTTSCLSQSIDDLENFEEVSRMNYGVVFTPVRLVTVVTEVWSHVFDLHLPNVTTSAPEFHSLYCENATSNAQQIEEKETCERNRQVIIQLYNQHFDMERQIRLALQHIYHLLPTERKLPRRFGQKRSLLPFGGYLLNELFGTATDDELRPLREHISRLTGGISKLGHGLQVQHQQFSSFVQLSADRMDIFTNISTAQGRVLSDLQDKFRLLHENVGRDQHRLIVATQSLLQYINHLRHIDELRQSIELLLQGILTPQLVPKLILRTTLLGIKREMARLFPDIHLVFDRAMILLRYAQFSLWSSRSPSAHTTAGTTHNVSPPIPTFQGHVISRSCYRSTFSHYRIT